MVGVGAMVAVLAQLTGVTAAMGQDVGTAHSREREGAGPPAPEEPKHGDALSSSKVSPAAAASHDEALRAKAKDRSIEDVRAERRTAERLGRVQAALIEEFGDEFAGAFLAEDGGARPTIRFKAKAPQRARNLIAAEKLDAVLVEDAGHSLAELQTQTDVAMDALADADFSQSLSYVDQRIGRIVLEVTATPEARTEEEVRKRLPASLSDYDVAITVHDGEFLQVEHTRGGAWMTDDGVRECTAGWSVKRISDGVEGIATAAHCFGLNGYEEPGVGVYSAPFVTEHIGDFGEMEWHTTSHIELAEFHATSSQIRDVLSVEAANAISVGESVCVYGRSSNSRACDLTVEATNVSVTYSYAGSTVTAKRMVRMNGDRTIAGDSGGGWSWGTRSYGIHFGDAAGKNVWSVADYLDEAIGVTVLKK